MNYNDLIARIKGTTWRHKSGDPMEWTVCFIASDNAIPTSPANVMITLRQASRYMTIPAALLVSDFLEKKVIAGDQGDTQTSPPNPFT